MLVPRILRQVAVVSTDNAALGVDGKVGHCGVRILFSKEENNEQSREEGGGEEGGGEEGGGEGGGEESR